VHGT